MVLLRPIGREKANFSSHSLVLRPEVTTSICPSSNMMSMSFQLLSYSTYWKFRWEYLAARFRNSTP